MPPDETSSRPTPVVALASGFSAGVAVTGLLNPVDRALYLSVSKKRSFLHPGNWKRPFQGLGQSLFGRAISTGLWFPLESMAVQAFEGLEVPQGVANAVAGQTAGAVNALLLSPLSFVKYQTWGLPEGKRSFGRTASKVYRTAGVMAFFRGLPATVVRDAIFGGIFGLRVSFRGRAEQLAPPASGSSRSGSSGYLAAALFAADAAAAGAATVVSSPFNYARNVQFGTPITSAPPSTMAAIGKLWREARTQPTAAAGVRVLLQRTNVGWGTLRVAGGMALTASIFSSFVRMASWLQMQSVHRVEPREPGPRDR